MGTADGRAGICEGVWVSGWDRAITGVGVHGEAGFRVGEGHVRGCDDGSAEPTEGKVGHGGV